MYMANLKIILFRKIIKNIIENEKLFTSIDIIILFQTTKIFER